MGERVGGWVGVLCYDVGEDGTILYSNWSVIYSIRSDGMKREVARDTMVRQVIALSANGKSGAVWLRGTR